MNQDLMLAAGVQLATITACVWGLTEALGHNRPGRKPLIAVGLGMALAVAAHAVGFLTALPEPRFKGSTYLAAAFAGLVCTVAAKLAHDGILTPILEWRKGVPIPAPATTTVTTKEEVVTMPTVLPPEPGKP